MNRIAKIWEELDQKQGRVKLSAPAKKRNVKLSLVEEFQDAMTTAQNTMDMNVYQQLQEFHFDLEQLRAKARSLDSQGYFSANFFKDLQNSIQEYRNELVEKGQDLGVDIFKQTDYNLGDVLEVIEHLEDVIEQSENALDLINDFKI